MYQNKIVLKESTFQSPRSSTSTIDSNVAAEIVESYETDTRVPAKCMSKTFTSPKVQNTMTFDKNDGIHVGDVINYYYNSPVQPKSPNFHDVRKSQSTSHSESTLITPVDSKERKIFTFVSRKSNLLLIAISIVIIAVITGGIIFMMRHKLIAIDMTETTTVKVIVSPSTETSVDSTSTTNIPITRPSDESTTIIGSTTPTLPSIITLESFISRKQWNAEVSHATVALKLPIYRIIIAQTNSHGCNLQKECTKFVKELQTNSKNLDDLPYNFLIGNDSKIYEGRGFKYEGQHTMNEFATEYNSIGICVAFIGNYQSDNLYESQMEIFQEFVEYFKKLGVIHVNYTIFMQHQLIDLDVAINLEKTFENLMEYRRVQKIYHRHEWEAAMPNKLEKFELPMNWSIITSTAGSECKNFTDCAIAVKNLQIEVINDGLDDIPFAFVIGNDGQIFEGRGWDHIGQHTENFDTLTVAICVIGSYGLQYPSQSIIDATQNLLSDGVALGKLTSDYRVNGRQELGQRLSGPGGDFLKIIRTWPHWHFRGIPKKRKRE